MSQLSPVDLGNLWPEVQGICHGVVAGDGTVNLSNPRAIFAGSRPRFTRSRVTYEAYVVSRTSTRPQVDSAGWTVIEHPDEILFCIGHRGLDIDPEPSECLDQTAVGGAALQHHRPQKSEQRLARVLGLQQCVPIVDDPAEPVLDDRPE